MLFINDTKGGFRLKRWLLFLVAALLALVLVACTANDDAGKETGDTKGDSDTEDAKGNDGSSSDEKILYMNNSDEPTSFDPSIGFNAVSWSSLNNLMEGLTRLNEDHLAVEATAEKIDVSEDGLTYTFTIRENAKWSNGDPVVAGDFVFAWQHMLNPETASPAAFLAYFIEGAEDYNNGEGSVEDVAIEASDDQTFVVTLTAPNEAFLNIITNPSFFPIHEKVATENPDWHTEASSFVSNGPFKLSAWDHDVSFEFEKNEHYWDADVVKLDRVHWAMINETTTEYQMYQADELDISGIPAEIAEQLKDSDELRIDDEAGSYFFRLNTSMEPFTNKKIRQAFGLAVDQQEIVDFVTKNGEKPAHGFVPYGFIGPDGKEFRDSVGDLVTFSPDEAKKLLQEGMEEEGYTELPEVTLTYSTGESHENIAIALQSKYKEVLDVEIELQNVEGSVFLAEQKELKHQMSRSSFLHDYADPVNALESFITDSSMNRTTWSNEDYDKLIADIKNETDEEARWALLQDADRLLMEEMPVFPLYFYNQTTLEKPGVSGILRHPVGYVDLKYADKSE